MQPLFGTDGIRTAFGKEPLTVQSLVKLGQAIAYYLQQTHPTFKIAIACDTRSSSMLCKSAIKTGLLGYTAHIEDYGVTPTPVLHHNVMHKDYNLGIMITASHNPACDNGIKLLTPSGKLNTQDQAAITELFYSDTIQINNRHFGTDYFISNTNNEYKTALQKRFPKNFLNGKKIILDCANGALSFLATEVFKNFGANVITIANNPDGNNINDNCGSLHPGLLQATIIEEKADFGFAFDGDGDRVIAVNNKGEIKDGDDILALLADHPTYKKQNIFATTHMSNEGLIKHFEKQNKKIVRTPIGDHHVIEKLKEQHALLGAEVSGHIILGDFGFTADGLHSALMIAQTILLTQNFEMVTFKKFPQVLINVPVGQKKDLTQAPFCTLINEYETKLKHGRLLVRYSGTEPVLRVMVEAQDTEQALQEAQHLSKTLEQMLQT